MKLVYIAPIRLPTERAHGYAIMKMCSEFAKAGNEVELIVPEKFSGGISERDPFAFYDIPARFKLRRIPATDLLGTDDNRGKFSYWLDTLAFICSVWMFCSKSLLAADVVYTRDYNLVRFLPRKKTVLELHTLPRESKRFMSAIRSLRKIVVLTDAAKNDLHASNPDMQICVARDAVDLDRYANLVSLAEARKKLGLPADVPMALYAGHFYTWKGAEIFAQSAAYTPGVLHVLVGGVDEDYRQLYAEYLDQENVRIIPFQKYDTLNLYFAAADMFVLPNRSTNEISVRYTSPLKLFEYMAAGKPIVASDLPSIREIVDDNFVCFVQPDSPEALAVGIQNVTAHADAAREKAARALQNVQKYGWDTRAEFILKFIRTISS